MGTDAMSLSRRLVEKRMKKVAADAPASKSDIARLEAQLDKSAATNKEDLGGVKIDLEGVKADVGGVKVSLARLEEGVAATKDSIQVIFRLVLLLLGSVLGLVVLVVKSFLD